MDIASLTAWNVFIFVMFGLLVLVGFYFFYKATKRSSELVEENQKLVEENGKILSQKKSSEIRLGKIAEHMAPFVKDWPYDPNYFRFLGSPIDGIQFNEDSILFIEIKTGKSRLTDTQRDIKQLVKEGKVKFASFTIDEKGVDFEIEE
jgi:predicted Holliday junction resolvase-like endonuclease